MRTIQYGELPITTNVTSCSANAWATGVLRFEERRRASATLNSGFTLADVQCWSEWRVGTVLPAWTQRQEQSADNGVLHFIRGDEFEGVRLDWAESWWR